PSVLHPMSTFFRIINTLYLFNFPYYLCLFTLKNKGIIIVQTWLKPRGYKRLKAAMTKIKVLIADDHEILRYGMSTFLSSADNIEVVGEASTGEECLELFKKTQPDVCVLDISMPHKDGIETTHAIRKIDPEIKILILSMHIDKEILHNVMEAGINRYLLKNTEKTDILHGIQAIAKGQQVFSDSISRLITNSFINKGNSDMLAPAEKNITKRELEVLQLIVEGY